MKKLFLHLSSLGLLLAGLQATPLYSADDEAKAPVPTRADASNPDSEVYRASDVMNMPVKDDGGNEVGRIKDFVINGETREVLYAVVAMNEAKEKDSLYVIPWTAFQPNYAQQGTTLQYTVLTLPQTVWIQAPFYSASQWRTAPFSQWGPRVNTYYSQHIKVGSTSRATTFGVNKPALKDGQSKDAASNPQKPHREDGAKGNDKAPQKEDKPAAKEKADKPTNAPKPDKSVEPKQSEKPAPKPQEKPAVKGEQVKEEQAKLPAPKNPDPASPNTPIPAAKKLEKNPK